MKPNTAFALRGNLVDSASPTQLRCREDHFLVCEDGRVAGVFPRLPDRYAHLPVEDWSGRLIIPGLTDLHTHAPQYAFRGLGMDLELLDWLEARTFPEEAGYADLDYARRAYGLFVQELQDGAATRACVFATVHRESTLLLMELLEKSGLVTRVGKVNMDRNCPDSLREPSAQASLAATRRWLEACAGFRHTRPILTPRFIPSCSDELLAGLAAVQRETGLPVQSHLSENPSEVEWVRQLCPDAAGYGEAYLRRGLLGGENCPTVMAHCVYSDAAERRLLKEQGVWVAHCPQSNTNLSSGAAPVRAFLEEGVRVGLGSDVAGGHTLSILRAIADAVQVSKLRWRLVEGGARPLTLPEAFWLATAGGGAFFGQVGRFEPGWAFDAVVLEDSAYPHPQPLSSLERLERLCYLCSDDRRAVVRKFVEGRPAAGAAPRNP